MDPAATMDGFFHEYSDWISNVKYTFQGNMVLGGWNRIKKFTQIYTGKRELSKTLPTNAWKFQQEMIALGLNAFGVTGWISGFTWERVLFKNFKRPDYHRQKSGEQSSWIY